MNDTFCYSQICNRLVRDVLVLFFGQYGHFCVYFKEFLRSSTAAAYNLNNEVVLVLVSEYTDYAAITMDTFYLVSL